MSLLGKRKMSAALLIAATVLTLAAVVYVYINYTSKPSTDTKESYIATHRVITPKKTVELKVRIRDRQEIVFVNGEIQERLGVSTKEPRVCLEFTEVHGGADLKAENRIDPITWESNIVQSSQYIQHLKDSGYTPIRTQQTAEYIEIYMRKENSTKRIVVLNDLILVAESITDELSNIDNRLTKWMEE